MNDYEQQGDQNKNVKNQNFNLTIQDYYNIFCQNNIKLFQNYNIY